MAGGLAAWEAAQLPVDVIVPAGSTVSVDYTFTNGTVNLTDTGPSSRESIYIVIQRPGPVTGTGGGVLIDPGTTVNYTFTLTGATGNITGTTATGTLPGSTDAGGTITIHPDAEFTNGTLSFKDMHLTLTTVTGSLTFTEVTLGVDADTVTITTVPEPASLTSVALGGVALLALCLNKQRDGEGRKT